MKEKIGSTKYVNLLFGRTLKKRKATKASEDQCSPTEIKQSRKYKRYRLSYKKHTDSNPIGKASACLMALPA